LLDRIEPEVAFAHGARGAAETKKGASEGIAGATTIDSILAITNDLMQTVQKACCVGGPAVRTTSGAASSGVNPAAAAGEFLGWMQPAKRGCVISLSRVLYDQVNKASGQQHVLPADPVDMVKAMVAKWATGLPVPAGGAGGGGGGGGATPAATLHPDWDKTQGQCVKQYTCKFEDALTDKNQEGSDGGALGSFALFTFLGELPSVFPTAFDTGSSGTSHSPGMGQALLLPMSGPVPVREARVLFALGKVGTKCVVRHTVYTHDCGQHVFSNRYCGFMWEWLVRGGSAAGHPNLEESFEPTADLPAGLAGSTAGGGVEEDAFHWSSCSAFCQRSRLRGSRICAV
jgi:hypothetical protein